MSEPRPFELRAGMQLMQRLLLCDTDVESFRRALEETVTQAPGMFQGALVALDLAPLQETEALPDFVALDAALREAGIIPAGISNAGPTQAEAAQTAGWKLLGGQRERAVEEAPKPESDRTPVRVVSQPVRSGQQIHTLGDLILLAPVSAGAEVLAGGSIYVHAPLRGRALAGILGDDTATISCAVLHAELVSVAGHYRTLEEPEAGQRGGPAYIHLDGEQLRIETV
ncbi:septum site-determining protein MinC [Thiohalomonas denitrificans]|uniref:septum site-determining protein MinC n=1 Tax=Thiohalomonas denitrificans TaxID=415747 RepID=UPI0026F27769|nr:septum site-determining protein MinC [Thiohalomonas denitrificans]